MKTKFKPSTIGTANLTVFARKFLLALALAGIAASLHAQTIIASGQISGVAAGANTYDYTLKVSEGSGTTNPIASIWYAWVPGAFYLPGDPTSAAGPTGWTATIIANSIQYQSTSAIYDIAPGSSMTFTYVASFSPAQLAAAANSGLSFAYAGQVDASTPDEEFTVQAAPVAPTLSVTGPASGTVFAAPANVSIVASTNGSSVIVTNVRFFANTASLGSTAIAPFDIVASNLAAGPYALTAVATASGISATSPAVNITVVNPSPVVISGVSVITNQINFNYTADIGLSYFVQRSSNFVTWTSFPTNVATSNPALFSSPLPNSSFKYYRVGRLPNP